MDNATQFALPAASNNVSKKKTKRRRASKLDAHLPFMLEKWDKNWSAKMILDSLIKKFKVQIKSRQTVHRRIVKFLKGE